MQFPRVLAGKFQANLMAFFHNTTFLWCKIVSIKLTEQLIKQSEDPSNLVWFDIGQIYD